MNESESYWKGDAWTSRPDLPSQEVYRVHSKNHTTRLNTILVASMAQSGRVNINPEDLRGGNGTMRRALELWSCRHGPVQYNQWQSVYFALIREHGYVDEEAAVGELPSTRQGRIRGMFHEIQE